MSKEQGDPAEDKPDVVLGAAGQSIDRREILKRGTLGFTILQVGAGAIHAVPQISSCGKYLNNQLVLDHPHCGSTKGTEVESDGACGKSTTKGGALKADDVDCTGTLEDNACGKLASETSYYSDEACHSGSESDLDCGKAGPEGEPWVDNAI